MYLLIRDQFRAPNRSTNRVRIRSSSALHGPLIRSDFGEKSEDVSEEEELAEEVGLKMSICCYCSACLLFLLSLVKFCLFSLVWRSEDDGDDTV